MTTTWFGYEYIQNGGSYQYDLLKVNAPESDGINHSENYTFYNLLLQPHQLAIIIERLQIHQ